MADLSLIGMTAALLAGAISFVSPCVESHNIKKI